MVETCTYKPSCDKYEPAVRELASGLNLEAYSEEEARRVAVQAIADQCTRKHESGELLPDECLHRIEIGETV